jgi:hypothetical protein
MTQHHAHDLTTHKQYDKHQDSLVMYTLRNSEPRAINYPCEEGIKMYV